SLLLIGLILSPTLQANQPERKGEPPAPVPPADVYKYAGLPPQKAAEVMTVPEGFEVKLFAGEPDVHQPIAMCLDDRGRVWVAEAYCYPKRRPGNGPLLELSDKKQGDRGDRILIFEDTDGDGKFDKCTVFMHSRVGKPGTPSDERTRINAGIWRYHPTKHVFEVFAHGTSNPWGLDYDEHGQFFCEACVIPHLFHIFQGGRYHRQAGAHFN